MPQLRPPQGQEQGQERGLGAGAGRGLGAGEGGGPRGSLLHPQHVLSQQQRHSEKTHQCPGSAISCLALTTLLQPLEKARPESKSPPSKEVSAPPTPTCKQQLSHQSREQSVPTHPGWAMAVVPVSSPHRRTHGLRRRTKLTGHRKE